MAPTYEVDQQLSVTNEVMGPGTIIETSYSTWKLGWVISNGTPGVFVQSTLSTFLNEALALVYLKSKGVVSGKKISEWPKTSGGVMDGYQFGDATKYAREAR